MFSSGAVRQRGVTLIELIIFIVIVGVAVVGVLGVMSLTTRHSADPLRHKQALMIAQGLLEEVELAKFTYCDPADTNADTAGSASECTVAEAFGPEQNNARPFDNINDYVSAAGAPAAAFNVGGLLSDANGNPMDVQGYSATLTITPAQIGPSGALVGSAGDTSADTPLLHIRVVVTYDGNQQVALDGYRARYAPKSL